MQTITSILEAAQQFAKEQNCPYKGALTPKEANNILHATPQAKLIDVRCRAELDWVGRIPNALEIEWATYPGMKPNPNFLSELEQLVNKHDLLFFICRSGARSNTAASLATQAGYDNCYNVLEGFEGEQNSDKHRNESNGWRAAKLPWIQG